MYYYYKLCGIIIAKHLTKLAFLMTTVNWFYVLFCVVAVVLETAKQMYVIFDWNSIIIARDLGPFETQHKPLKKDLMKI